MVTEVRSVGVVVRVLDIVPRTEERGVVKVVGVGGWGD